MFKDCGKRLMCWPHCYRKTSEHLITLRKEDAPLADSIMADIEFLQWSAHNECTFRHVFDLLEFKYINKDDVFEKKAELVRSFFDYFRKQWIESPVFRWYEGAHPWAVSNNQGIEGTNKEIKAGHTFKRRCNLGAFMNIVLRMIEDFGKIDDSLLFLPRISLLDHSEFRNGLKLKTEGYQWLKSNKVGLSDRILCINKAGKYTVSEALEFQLGNVDQLWAVASSSNALTGKSLKERAKRRVKERGDPTFAPFDEYKEVRTSCWIVEERGGDFYCDCPVSMKGKLCKITTGFYYRQGMLEVSSHVRCVPIGQKRKRGRPKKLPNCLERSPPSLPSVPDDHQIAPSQPVSMPESPICVLSRQRKRKVQPEVQSSRVMTRKRRKCTEEKSSPDKLTYGLRNQAPPKSKVKGLKTEVSIEVL